MTADLLHIEFTHGGPVVQYRIHHGHIEMRIPSESEASQPNPNGSWRRLSAREFSAHLAQNPALAHWLRARAQSPRPGPGQTEDETSAA